MKLNTVAVALIYAGDGKKASWKILMAELVLLHLFFTIEAEGLRLKFFPSQLIAGNSVLSRAPLITRIFQCRTN